MRLAELKNNFDYVAMVANKIFMWNKDRVVEIEAEIEDLRVMVDNPVVIDKTSFGIIQKMGNVSFEVKDNKLCCVNQLGKYFAPILDLYVPNVDWLNIEGKGITFINKDVKRISKCCAKKDSCSAFNGVIFYENGTILATDRFKGQAIDFKYEENLKAWSIPVEFFDYLPDSKCGIILTDTYAVYKSMGYQVCTRLYNSEIPNVLKVIASCLGKGFKTDWERLPEYSLCPTDYVNIKIVDNGITLDFADNDNNVLFTTTKQFDDSGYSFNGWLPYDRLGFLGGEVYFDKPERPITCKENNISTFVMQLRR